MSSDARLERVSGRTYRIRNRPAAEQKRTRQTAPSEAQREAAAPRINRLVAGLARRAGAGGAPM